MISIDLKRARLKRNVDYFLGGLWFCLGIYLLSLGCHFASGVYLCIGPFIAFNAWTSYEVKVIFNMSNEVLGGLEKQNKRLIKMIEALNQPGYDDYEGEYVE